MALPCFRSGSSTSGPSHALPHCLAACCRQVQRLQEELEAAQSAAARAAELTAEWRGRAEAFDRDRQAAASNIRWVVGLRWAAIVAVYPTARRCKTVHAGRRCAMCKM